MLFRFELIPRVPWVKPDLAVGRSSPDNAGDETLGHPYRSQVLRPPSWLCLGTSAVYSSNAEGL